MLSYLICTKALIISISKTLELSFLNLLQGTVVDKVTLLTNVDVCSDTKMSFEIHLSSTAASICIM